MRALALITAALFAATAFGQVRTIPKDAKRAKMSHVQEQISYCISGRFEYLLDGQTHLLSAGHSIYVPSGVRHGAKALEAGTLIDVFTPVREDLLERR